MITMNNITIERYGDDEWHVHSPDLKRDIVFSVEGATHENAFELVTQIVQKTVANDGFKAAKEVLCFDRKWKIEPTARSIIKKAMAAATSLVHKESDIGLQRFTIKAHGRAQKKQHATFLKELRQIAPKATDDQLEKGVRAIKSFTKSHLPYADAYTELASFAYSHGYERHYSAKDDVGPSDSDCCLVKSGDELLLVLGRDKSLVTQDANKEVVSNYKEFLVEEFGSRKVEDVQRAFGIDFTKMITDGLPLTPEHVYRMNIGLSAVDAHDVTDLLNKLPALLEVLKSVPDEEERTAKQIANATGIPHRIIAMLEHKLIGTKVSGSETESGEESEVQSLVENLQGWLLKLNPLPKTFAEISEDQLQTLMQPLQVDDAAFERALTGRRIRKPLLSGYSTAELGKEKLWVDRQELSQGCEVMAKTKNWDLWLEKLDHVVVKANMLKGSDATGFTIDALIPAPQSDDGQSRWYRVTRCISNGYGIFTYTLEPAANDSTLPAIFVARSTASSEYALHGLDSVLNDLNALNPPGYEGQVLNAPYDAKFFKKYTIPTWVGHLLSAQKSLDTDQDAAYRSLIAANRNMLNDVVRKLGPRSLEVVAGEYDWLLNRIGLELKYSNLVMGGYLGIYKDIMNKYVGARERGESIDAAKELTDALKLKKLLEEIKTQKLDQYVLSGIDRLIGELDHYIIDGSQSKAQGQMLNQYMAENFSKVDKFESQARLAFSHGFTDQIPGLLKDWSTALNQRAKDLQELPEFKQKSGLFVTGQSLGGAIAQVTMCRQLVQQNRIPVSQVHAYTISAPGIRHEDNSAFIAYADETKNVRKAIGSEIKVSHLTESGDFVFLTGQGHLAAAHDEDDEQKLADSITFRGEVREMIPGAMEYQVVHETQFMEGKQGEHYHMHPISTRDLGKIDDAQKVISKNKAAEKELLLEAKLFKQRFKFSTFLDEKLLSKVPKNTLLIKRHLHQQRALAPGHGQRDTQGVFIAEGL